MLRNTWRNGGRRTKLSRLIISTDVWFEYENGTLILAFGARRGGLTLPKQQQQQKKVTQLTWLRRREHHAWHPGRTSGNTVCHRWSSLCDLKIKKGKKERKKIELTIIVESCHMPSIAWATQGSCGITETSGSCSTIPLCNLRGNERRERSVSLHFNFTISLLLLFETTTKAPPSLFQSQMVNYFIHYWNVRRGNKLH